MNIDDIKPGMDPDSRSAAKREIEQVLRAMNAEPNPEGFTEYNGVKLLEGEAGKRERDLIVIGLLKKPAHELTAEDKNILRSYLRKAEGRYARI